MLNPDFAEMLSALSAEQVQFLLVGAYALGAHGLPRATGDIDLWVAPNAKNAARVVRALQHFGAPLFDLMAKDLARPGTVLQLGIAPRRIDILTAIAGVTFEKAWAGRLTTQLGGLAISVLGRAELLANKKAAGRPKDLADVKALEAFELSKRKRAPARSRATRKPTRKR